MKKYLWALALVAVIIPSVSFAAWWNPFSWGNKEESVYIEPIETFAEPEAVLGAETSIPEPIVIEKPVIKTQTITVTDPALQAQIDALVAENNALSQEIYDLEVSKSALTSEFAVCEDNLVQADESEECTEAQEEVVSLNQELVDALATHNAEYAEIMKNEQGVFGGGALASEVEQLSDAYTIERDAIYAELNLASSKVGLYCE